MNISVGKTGLLLLFKFLFELLSSYAVNVMLRYSFTIFDKLILFSCSLVIYYVNDLVLFVNRIR